MKITFNVLFLILFLAVIGFSIKKGWTDEVMPSLEIKDVLILNDVESQEVSDYLGAKYKVSMQVDLDNNINYWTISKKE